MHTAPKISRSTLLSYVHSNLTSADMGFTAPIVRVSIGLQEALP
uniref:Uncharacterized protein n=1 Tax=Megaselia scalaris TaxID=36166 RepID=T1GQA4_MEGSC